MKNVCIEHDNQTHFDAILNKKRIKTREISNWQHEVCESTRIRRGKCSNAAGSRCHHRSRKPLQKSGNKKYLVSGRLWLIDKLPKKEDTGICQKPERHHTTDRKSFQQGDLKQNNYGPKIRIKRARFRNEDNVENTCSPYDDIFQNNVSNEKQVAM